MSKKVIPQVSLTIDLWDKDAMPGSDKMIHLAVERSTGAEGLADMEANTRRLAEQLIGEAFSRLRAKLALMGKLAETPQ